MNVKLDNVGLNKKNLNVRLNVRRNVSSPWYAQFSPNYAILKFSPQWLQLCQIYLIILKFCLIIN